MKRFGAGLAAVLCLGTGVQAQAPIGSYTPPQVNPYPTVSPYLNLNRNLNSATNYFGVVRPQFDNQQAIQQLQQQYQAIQGTQGMMPAGTGPVAPEEIAPTGHRMGGSFNYSHYYPLFYTGGGFGGSATGGAVSGGIPGYNGAAFGGPGGYGGYGAGGLFGAAYGQVGYGFIR
jgi:hypothetical protein